jgi:GNAT superfamily N-acetyltransferase
LSLGQGAIRLLQDGNAGEGVSITYRPTRRAELQRHQNLIVTAINDLTDRHGFTAMASVRPAVFQHFSFDDDARGLWTAEGAEEIVGSAFSWVCDDLWFLAELFTAPGYQGGGIGRELLRRTLNYANQAGATKRALITFSFNTISQGLYIRDGLFPRLPLYMFAGARKSRDEMVRDQMPEITALEATEAHVASLVRLDKSALGISREKHHRFLFSDPTVKGFLFSENGQPTAYAYVSSTGHVGPLAVSNSALMESVLKAAFKIAEAESSQVSAFLPGNCEAALKVASERGMRITLPMVLVSDQDFGDWRRYLPRNPGFM